MQASPEVLVRGSGCVARSLALALGAQGLRVALLDLGAGAPARAGGTADVRSYALNAGSVALLRELRVWEGLPADAVTPVYDMAVHGDAAGVLGFSAWQQGVAELAFIVDAAALEEQLAQALRFAPHVQLVSSPLAAALTAICEGRDAAGRAERGVRFEPRDYGQRAIAARLRAAAPHQGVARQWFRAPDVLALLPASRPDAGASYSLVWSLPAARADELLALDDAAFEAALAEATGLELALASPRMSWPLQLARAEPLLGPGWVLLGDAAHTVHPLAGQGLNLGLADVASLARVIRARESWRSLGDERLLRRYARERLAATWAMGELTDGLLRLFAADSALAREVRNRGLSLLDAAAPLKRWLTRQAIGT
ncbi:MAG: FAD-dependent monooxygenase [Pelomonas sp.]|nr:FAD-dependent monooxygenase [Roseateles sp.]